MTNPSFRPETKSYRVAKKNYEEVHVQAGEKVSVPLADLVDVKRGLPDWAQPAFAGFEKLNPVQSKVFPVAFCEFFENMLICAPTGAGKTNIAMLTIMNVVSQAVDEPTGQIDLSQFKIVYIAPMKALVQEVVKSFSLRLNPLGIQVGELSGDANIGREQMAKTQVIVTTPEKWDVVTRKAGENRGFTSLVRLIIIDEVHLLHDSRGPVLEAIVARTVRQIEQTQEYVRIVALSATLPNYRDVALFLRVNLDRGLFYFGSEYRPVPLDQTYVGISSKKALKRAQVTNEVVFEKVMDEVGKNQVLVFVHGRKETVRTARELRRLAEEKGEEKKFSSSDSKGVLTHESEKVKTVDLKDLLSFGIAVHHAGLPSADRSLVEDLFAARHVSVCVCTLTLAWGVNLPAHTVIIKGTQIYQPEKGAWVELSPMDMMQMMGRAGRPQYDSSGHGIVITNADQLQYYLSLNNMQLPIESQLISVLPDLVNAELTLGTMGNRDDVVKWIGYTYLHVRMMQNPALYGISPEEAETDPKLVQRRVDLAHAALTMLDKNGLVKYDRKSGSAQITAIGRIASYFYLRHESVAGYADLLKPGLTDMDLLRVFAQSREFKFIPVREEEKVELTKLVELVPIPLKGGAEDPSSKINVLLQAFISRLSLEGFALTADLVFVQQNAGRLFRALFEIALKRGWATLARRCLVWCKMVELRMWPVQTQLRHFRSVSEDVCRKIERKGFSNEELASLSPDEFGDLVRNGRLGHSLHALVGQIPQLDIVAYVQPVSRSCLMVKVDIEPRFEYSPLVHADLEYFWIFVEDVSQQFCLYSDQFALKPFQIQNKHVLTLSFSVAVTEPVPPCYFVRVVSDRWMGAETVRPISFRHLVLPAQNPAPTELLDLDPLPVEALEFPEAEMIMKTGGITQFTAVQTMAFEKLFRSDENVFLACPDGRTVCAELAIFRWLKCREGNSRCLFLTPVRATHRIGVWSRKFAPLGITVGALGKDDSPADLIVATPSEWDLLTRRPKRAKAFFATLSLVVVDSLQLLGEVETGVVLEVAITRMKGAEFRIVGLSASVANCSDLAGWMGIRTVFNFAPHARQSALEMVIHGLDVFNTNARQLAMLRPLYKHVIARPSSVLIFATDRRQAVVAAADLVLQAMADGHKFVHTEIDVTTIEDAGLSKVLSHGIGYIHSGLSEQDKLTVSDLFRTNAIQLLIVTPELIWTHTFRAALVVVLDTTEAYRAPDLVEMVRCAGNKCVLFCANSKREFFKKFLAEPIPVESVIDEEFADIVNTEVSNGGLKSQSDCVDWLARTLFFRRLSRNPNFYALPAADPQLLSDHLSALVEETTDGLSAAGLIQVEPSDGSLSPGDLGLIASFHAVKVSTIERFRRGISGQSKRKQLLELLASASEFHAVEAESGNVLGLLNAHFNRTTLPYELHSQLSHVLPIAHKLVLALVDVISTCGYLKVALAAMSIAPMLVQGLSQSASPLLQLPHFDTDRCNLANQLGVEDVIDILAMESEEQRSKLFVDLSQTQVSDIARTCNNFPSITVHAQVENEAVMVTLERDGQAGSRVHAPLFPKPKEEGWWLVVGAGETLVDIKRVTCAQKEQFAMRAEPGVPLQLFLMSDSYIGCDQEEGL